MIMVVYCICSALYQTTLGKPALNVAVNKVPMLTQEDKVFLTSKFKFFRKIPNH